MLRTLRTAIPTAGLLATCATALANPITSVSINGSITFSDVIERGNPTPMGRLGVSTIDSWVPSSLSLVTPHPRVAQFSRFLVDDAPQEPNDQAPNVGDAWGMSMLASIELMEDGTVSGRAGHALHLRFADMTHGRSIFVLRGILDLTITGHVQATAAPRQSAVTHITADAFSRTDTSFARLITFGDVELSTTGDRAVNRSLWSTFEVTLDGTRDPGHQATAEMWIDVTFATTLTSAPAPASALALLALAAPRRRRSATYA